MPTALPARHSLGRSNTHPMATQNVYIETDGVSYDPTIPEVKPGDTVNFFMDERYDTVTVDFGTNSPFGQTTNFSLNGADPSLAAQSYTVDNNAIAGRYPFSATPQIKKGDPEPTGTVSGDLEVVTGPKDT
jgi:plastocyanin